MTTERGPQREVFESLWADGWDGRPSADCGREALRRLEERVVSGETWAGSIIARHAARSLTTDWKLYRKEMAPKIAVSYDGEVIGVYGEISEPIRDDNGVPTGGWQPAMIRFLTWDALRAAYQRERARIKRLTANAFALRELLAYHDRCPEAATPYEACVALRIDPDSIQVEAS
jgi:hypothetical protein